MVVVAVEVGVGVEGGVGGVGVKVGGVGEGVGVGVVGEGVGKLSELSRW